MLAATSTTASSHGSTSFSRAHEVLFEIYGRMRWKRSLGLISLHSIFHSLFK